MKALKGVGHIPANFVVSDSDWGYIFDLLSLFNGRMTSFHTGATATMEMLAAWSLSRGGKDERWATGVIS